MSESSSKVYEYKVLGTHCASCEILLERRFKEVAGVTKTKVNHLNGRVKITAEAEPSFEELRQIARSESYDLFYPTDGLGQSSYKKETISHWQTGGIFLAVMALLLVLSKLQLLPQGFGVKENMGYGFVFVIGLVAAVSSCLAVTGGLILALAARNQENHPEQSGWKKFRPFWHFNLGRLIGYAVFGGLIGLVGSALTVSVALSHTITIVASAAMIVLGVNLLEIFPRVKFLHPRLPKFLVHKIHDLQGNDRPWAGFTLGALTFFLPCGFTAALQLYVLANGGWLTGSLTMLVFALGTLPALLSVSALSSFIKGRPRLYFIKFAGALVVIIGMFNLNQVVSFINSNNATVKAEKNQVGQVSQSGNVEIIDGKQIAKMKVVGYEYIPSRFTINPDLPVEWQIDASKAAGCAQVLVAPALRLQEILPKSGIKKITFTPGALKKIAFSCAMGMTTPGAAFIIN
ncbi:MAG: sulfite exporter TauE/SafE family protein [Candidatus Komeilibacteria bacterium]|nr:sulfite exporter TauE/SafE family protein [Candidatus Komeilibacteria bacterium]